VDALIERHKDEWDLLVEKLAELRHEAVVGRQQGQHGMSKEVSAFFEHVVQVRRGLADIESGRTYGSDAAIAQLQQRRATFQTGKAAKEA